ncbi:MAG: hypothetical protein Q8R45_11705 [Brevundimonas sp.]|uniref:hypothetical protein n=1 Tax=Brevundimonas sp. TaxID=1871086 RepID=UPI0027373870|nr:hypothetical protein [Brevundimonas sp.]MDP3657618.1 hypothetical protein [Brevundimonas sp.]MDZ4109695.1 hypothetical protein [Brevundimonas sp.]MDZ4319643.1 hypothetical protein [Phenylobacterium sp.]
MQTRHPPDSRPESRYVTVSPDCWSLIRGACLSALTALRPAPAASGIAPLGSLFDGVEYDPAGQEAEAVAGRWMVRRFRPERALPLAHALALGRPLAPEYDEFAAPSELDE